MQGFGAWGHGKANRNHGRAKRSQRPQPAERAGRQIPLLRQRETKGALSKVRAGVPMQENGAPKALRLFGGTDTRLWNLGAATLKFCGFVFLRNRAVRGGGSPSPAEFGRV